MNQRPYSNNKEGDHTDGNDYHHDGINDSNNTSNNNYASTNGHSSTYIFLERFLHDTESPDSRKGRQHSHPQQAQPQQQHRWASTPPGTAKLSSRSSAGGGGKRISSGASVQRSASFHHLDQLNLPKNSTSSHGNGISRTHTVQARKNSPYSHSTSPNGRASLGSANLISPRASAKSPHLSASLSTHGQHASQRGSTGNLYTSERSHRPGSRYQPSLDYALGVSTDEEINTTDTSFSGHNYSKPQHQGRPKSSNSPAAHEREDNIYCQPFSNTGSDTETASCSQSQNEAEDPLGPRLSSRQMALLSAMSGQQKDAILCDAIQIGDRASITVNQKPPRYGRKKRKSMPILDILIKSSC